MTTSSASPSRTRATSWASSTPIEIVDFIIRSVSDVLEDEFGQTIGSPGVHIIDPFTGTGTSHHPPPSVRSDPARGTEHKFRHELHANEIVLLAYYIAAINIESVYHGISGGEYVPFSGILLTDTFDMGEAGRAGAGLPDNSERRRRQQGLDIRVIMGNPPYAVSQHINYPHLGDRIAETYAARSTATSKNALYDKLYPGHPLGRRPPGGQWCDGLCHQWRLG